MMDINGTYIDIPTLLRKGNLTEEQYKARLHHTNHYDIEEDLKKKFEKQNEDKFKIGR